jgi:hypothetical protein
MRIAVTTLFQLEDSLTLLIFEKDNISFCFDKGALPKGSPERI